MLQFIKGLGLGVILAGLSIVIATLAGWEFTISPLEVIAVATSYTCTWLCVKQSRWNYPIGVFSTFCYSILMWQWGMPALAIFNLYLVFSLAYGYWRWGPDGNSLPVTDLKMDHWALGYVGLGLGVLVLLLGIIYSFPLFGLDAPVINNLDIGAAVLSAVAQFLLDNKKRDTWIVWAIVNVFTIVLFFNQGLYLAMIQYVFFLGNTIYGWISWTKSMKKEENLNEYNLVAGE